MSLIYVGLGFMAFVAASTLAIDVGMFMTARSQAQTAADAGALAGATALAYDDYDDRSVGGPAVTSAMSTAAQNLVMAGAPSVQAGDVTFPLGPTGVDNRVQVNVFRTDARTNPVETLIGPVFGMPTVDIAATATAEASPSNAATCVAPFTIPDKWVEMQTPNWDPTDTFASNPNNGSGDVYRDANNANYTGYNAERDKGTRLTIKAGTGNNISPSFYYSLALPGSTGADDYRWNIANCNTSVMSFGAAMVPEPGNMVGPTAEGVQELIAQDPDAYWDATEKKVVSTKSPSPRVKVIPVYDPLVYDLGKQNSRNAELKAANFIGFFIEGMQGNDVVGRITPVGGLVDANSGPAPAGAFPMTIRLVK